MIAKKKDGDNLIPEELKSEIAREAIDREVGECIVKLRTNKTKELEKRHKELVQQREEIYKGNIEAINKLIARLGDNKNDWFKNKGKR